MIYVKIQNHGCSSNKRGYLKGTSRQNNWYDQSDGVDMLSQVARFDFVAPWVFQFQQNGGIHVALDNCVAIIQIIPG